jgi:hypothetical protein
VIDFAIAAPPAECDQEQGCYEQALNKHVEDEIILISRPLKPLLLVVRAASMASIPWRQVIGPWGFVVLFFAWLRRRSSEDEDI